MQNSDNLSRRKNKLGWFRGRFSRQAWRETPNKRNEQDIAAAQEDQETIQETLDDFDIEDLGVLEGWDCHFAAYLDDMLMHNTERYGAQLIMMRNSEEVEAFLNEQAFGKELQRVTDEHRKRSAPAENFE